MNIKSVSLRDIRPYENNVKDHPSSQLLAIKNSISRFGFRQPIVIDKNNVIVAGHARYQAAEELGFDVIPCEYADDLTEEEINAYRLLDNQIAEQGFISDEKLQLELEKLRDFDFSEFNVDFDHSSTWESDINLSQMHGEHTDGILGKVIINCDQVNVDRIKDEVVNMLKSKGFDDARVS